MSEDFEPRGPGSLVHRDDGDGWGPSGCLSCGWRGVPNMTGGVPDDRCPCCEADHPSHDVVVPMRRRPGPPSVSVGKKRAGRNDPCPCGSGVKHKRCCG